MNRRDLLKRLPGVPFAIGAAVTQAPALVRSLGTAYMAPVQVSTITMAQRVAWFTSALQGIARPAFPSTGPFLTLADEVRSVMQWEVWDRGVEQAARREGILLSDAQQIAQDFLEKQGT